MTEIDKMYKNAGTKKCNRMLPCPFENQCEDCEYNWYPDFTAEKQLELIKWLATNNNIDYCKYYHQEIKNVWVFVCVTLTEVASEAPKVYGDYKEYFEQALAGLTNNLWQDLTEEEKEEIRRILNENS